MTGSGLSFPMSTARWLPTKVLDRGRHRRGSAAARPRHRFHPHPAAGRRSACAFWSSRWGSRCRSALSTAVRSSSRDLKPIEQHLIPASGRNAVSKFWTNSASTSGFSQTIHGLVRAMATVNTFRTRAGDPGRSDIRRGFFSLICRCLQDCGRLRRCGSAPALRSRDAEGPRYAGAGGPVADLLPRRYAAGLGQGEPSLLRWPSVSASRPTRLPLSATCRTIWRCSGQRPLDCHGQRDRRRQETGVACHGFE